MGDEIIKINNEYRNKIENCLGMSIDSLVGLRYDHIKKQFQNIIQTFPEITLFYYEETFNGGGEMSANSKYTCLCYRNSLIEFEGDYYPRGDLPFEVCDDSFLSSFDWDDGYEDYDEYFDAITNKFDIAIAIFNSPFD